MSLNRRHCGRLTADARQDDPTETTDLSEARPDKVEELLARVRELQAEQLEPWPVADPPPEGKMAPKAKIATTAAGKARMVSEFFTLEGMPEGGEILLDGEPATISEPTADDAAGIPRDGPSSAAGGRARM